MKHQRVLIPFAVILAICCGVIGSQAEIRVVIAHNQNDDASRRFRFTNAPAISGTDAATQAKFSIVDGKLDDNGGSLERLHDGKGPMGADQPGGNVFFDAGTDGGRLLIELPGPIQIKGINSYSWHTDTRAPQVYNLYASDGANPSFDLRPKRGNDPEKSGWRLLARVDTRLTNKKEGGQYAVLVSDTEGLVGRYHYLLFDIFSTDTNSPFGNTFFSEIDVIDRDAPAVAEPPPAPVITETFETDDGKHQVIINTSHAPDLTEWARKELAPVMKEWYPKIIALLPSDGYVAPERVTLSFVEGMDPGIPAAAGGRRISCNVEWFRKNLKGEAKGSVVHELVHVVQQYGRTRRDDPNVIRFPDWLVEGIPDYIRWFKYEPQTHGAEIGARNLSRAKYDASYRVTGNFLNWAVETYNKDLVKHLNAAGREGRYNEKIWKTDTGHTVQELGEEWKKNLEKKLETESASKDEKRPGSLP